MINAVSERIRHIIKLQDQTPQSQLYGSRVNSLDSNHSAGNSKTITNNNYPPIPPRSPSKKTRSHIHKSQIHQIQQQIQQIQSIDNDQNQLIQKIKNKVMEFLFPFLEQISKKVQNLSNKVNNVEQSVRNINRSQQKWKEVQKWVTQVFMKIQTDFNNFQTKKLLTIQAQITNVKNQLNMFTKNLDKIAAETHVNQFLQSISAKQNKNTYTSKQTQQPSSIPLIISPQLTNPKLKTNQVIHKCKCEKLISQILQSQNHLMMELKYMKHFQDSGNNTQYQKDNQKKTFRKEYR